MDGGQNVLAGGNKPDICQNVEMLLLNSRLTGGGLHLAAILNVTALRFLHNKRRSCRQPPPLSSWKAQPSVWQPAGEPRHRQVGFHCRCLGADLIWLFGREKCSRVFRETQRYSGSKPGKLAQYERAGETETEGESDK